MLCCQRSERLCEPFQHRIQILFRRLYPDNGGIKLREFQQLLDQGLKFVGIAVDHLVPVGASSPRCFFKELFERTFHQHKRGSELVRQVGKEP